MNSGTDEVASLRLRIIDEFDATLKKLESGLLKSETQAKKTAQGMAGGFGSMSAKLQELEQIGVPGVGRLASAFGTAEAAQASFLGNMGLLVAGGAAVATGLGLLGKAAVGAASEGEQATVRLVSALKATGGYSEAAVADVEEFAASLLRTKGAGDELTMQLVGQGATMGLTIEQSKRFVSAAADMQDIIGSTAGAFDMLARASTGDERALSMLGKQFGISKDAGMSFAEMLAEIERKTDGNAAAKVKTFAGAWALFSEDVTNFLEKAGTPLMNWLAAQPNQIRAAGDAWATFFKSIAADKAWGMLERWQEWADRTANGRQIVQPPPQVQTPLPGYEPDKGRGIFFEYRDLEAGMKRAAELRKKDIADRLAAEKDAEKAIVEYKRGVREGEAAHQAQMAAIVQRLNEEAAQGAIRVRADQSRFVQAKAAADAAAEKQAVDTIISDIKRQESAYKGLVRQLEQATATYDRLKESAERNAQIGAAGLEGIAKTLREVEALGANESEQKVLARMEIDRLREKAKATGDLAEKMRALNEAAAIAARTDMSWSWADRWQTKNSQIPGVADYGNEIDTVRQREAAEATKELIRDLRSEAAAAIASVAAADQKMLDAQAAVMTDLDAKARAAGEQLEMVTQQAKTMAEELARKNVVNVSTSAAVQNLENVLDMIEHINSALEINFSPGAQVVLSPGGGYGGVNLGGGTPDAVPQSFDRLDRSAAPVSVTFNVAANGVSAKELDAELADLWARKSSKLRMRVQQHVREVA